VSGAVEVVELGAVVGGRFDAAEVSFSEEHAAVAPANTTSAAAATMALVARERRVQGRSRDVSDGIGQP